MVSFYLLGFETQATWLRANKGTSIVLERQRLEQITAHSREGETLLLTTAVSLSKVVHNQPSFRHFDFTQRQSKIEGLKQVNANSKRRETNLKNDSLSHLHSELQPVAHTPSFLFIFFHIPLLVVTARPR